MRQQLIDAGFTYEEWRGWSFSPVMRTTEGYWWKHFPGGRYTPEIEVGVIFNEEYGTMEIYICDCVVGCCGESYGCHPFSLDKIEQSLEEYRKSMQAVWGNPNLDETKSPKP